MPNGAITIEDERQMRLEEERIAAENAAAEAEEAALEAEEAARPKEEHFINTGEAVLLLAFTGIIAVIMALLDFIPYVGWIINVIISFSVGLILFIWITGKVARGAPKKWYKAIYYGAAGSFFGGYFGAIIYLLIQDRKILGKVAGKLGETMEKKVL